MLLRSYSIKRLSIRFCNIFLAFICLLYVFCNLITSVTFFPNDHQDKWRNLGISNIPLASKNKDPVLAITCGSHATPQNTKNALSLVAADGATNTPKTPQDSGIMITRRFVYFLFLWTTCSTFWIKFLYIWAGNVPFCFFELITGKLRLIKWQDL